MTITLFLREVILITDKDINKGLDEAYNKTKHNAYFGNGFKAGVKFAVEFEDKPEKCIECLGIPALDLLETRLDAGCQIEKCDMGWCLFDTDGECVCYGTTIRQMLVNLIFTDC